MHRHLQWHASFARTTAAERLTQTRDWHNHVILNKASRRVHMRSPWSRFSILLLPDPGPVLWFRSSDSLTSGETATFQSYRSSPAHLSSVGNIKHLFVLTKSSGDVPSRLLVGRGCCQLVYAPIIALHLWTSPLRLLKHRILCHCCGVTSVGWKSLIKKMPKHT